MKFNKSSIIGIIVILIITMLLSSSCLYEKPNKRTYEHVIHLPKGYKFITYKSSRGNLSYQLESMEPEYTPKNTKVILFRNLNSSYSYDIMSEFTFIESK